MNTNITDKDIEDLCQANPMANEQLRRIVAERQKAELLEEIQKLKNGSEEITDG